MAVGLEAINGCAMLSSSASPPPPSAFRCCPYHFRTIPFTSGIWFSPSRSGRRRLLLNYLDQVPVHSVADSFLRPPQSERKRNKLKAFCDTSEVGVRSSRELLEEKPENQGLRNGLLLEFKKNSDRVLLAVAQRPDGEKNWIVSDQNGVWSSIKPRQVTFVVPGVDNFDPAEISDFIQRAESNLDQSLVEMAWFELRGNSKPLTVQQLAQTMFGCVEPLESYCTHLLLSEDKIYFTMQATKVCYRPVYVPRPAVQVEERVHRKLEHEAADRELQEFVQLLKSAKSMPSNAKPSKSLWLAEERNRYWLESLEMYAIDEYQTDDRQKEAEMVLKEMQRVKTPSSALNLLKDIGYFPVHVNLDLLRFRIRTDHSEEITFAAENILSESSDPDEADRKDLTHLKVYTIDVDEADELDDALSATRLEDGRIKVWIHVADPARYVQPKSILDREAMSRGTSVFLPTATYPMFPEKLAMEGMSFRQGETCNAVTVSVVLRQDGSIAEYWVDNSIIKPTYMLTYESALELLYMNLEEEVELKILSEAATLRLKWRQEQGGIDTVGINARIKVQNPEEPEPSFNVYVENQSEPSVRLVSEMMILCGEVVATYGSFHNIPLPYRGQPQSDFDMSAFSHLPKGPVRSSALVKMMRAAEMDYGRPLRHGILGIPGYVQFTSPIRRYMDLLAHYQVKAFLRGESPPYSSGQLECIASHVTTQFKIVRTICDTALRYWILEYLRRQPKEKLFHALILRLVKDRIAAVLLVEVGLEDYVQVSSGTRVGDEIKVWVKSADPHNDVITLKEAYREDFSRRRFA